MKFPRAGNIFVSGDLSEKFISFDEVENPKNDILSNAGVHFTDSEDAKIIKEIKIFFNKMMNELDEKYPTFQSLMHEKVFKYEEGEGPNKKTKILNFKVGRKIP